MSQLIWTASLVTTKTFSLLEFLQMLVLREGKITKQSENEAIDLVEVVYETIDCEDTVSTQIGGDVTIEETVNSATAVNTYVDDPPIWVAGPYSPTSDVDRNRPAFTDRSCLLAS